VRNTSSGSRQITLTDWESDSWSQRLQIIYRATKQHALNLAKFVSIYKTLLLLQKKTNGGKQRSADTFIAGLLGGYVVFGNRNAVNEQASLSFRAENRKTAACLN
jgi:hypothetical protein